MSTEYVVCDRMLNPETNEHCEYDGHLEVGPRYRWVCPGCHAVRYGIESQYAEDQYALIVGKDES